MSGRVALGGARAGLGGLDLPVLRRGVGHEPVEQALRRGRDLFDRAREHLLVGLRRLRRAADLAYVLERGGADLVGGGGRLEVVELTDVAAHGTKDRLWRN